MADGCQADNPDLVKHLSTADAAARHGHPPGRASATRQLNYLGKSYGTFLGSDVRRPLPAARRPRRPRRRRAARPDQRRARARARPAASRSRRRPTSTTASPRRLPARLHAPRPRCRASTTSSGRSTASPCPTGDPSAPLLTEGVGLASASASRALRPGLVGRPHRRAAGGQGRQRRRASCSLRRRLRRPTAGRGLRRQHHGVDLPPSTASTAPTAPTSPPTETYAKDFSEKAPTWGATLAWGALPVRRVAGRRPLGGPHTISAAGSDPDRRRRHDARPRDDLRVVQAAARPARQRRARVLRRRRPHRLRSQQRPASTAPSTPTTCRGACPRTDSRAERGPAPRGPPGRADGVCRPAARLPAALPERRRVRPGGCVAVRGSERRSLPSPSSPSSQPSSSPSGASAARLPPPQPRGPVTSSGPRDPRARRASTPSPSSPARQDYPAALADFYTQKLDWSPCADNAKHRCATMEVPVDYAKPKRRPLHPRAAQGAGHRSRPSASAPSSSTPAVPEAPVCEYAQYASFVFSPAVRAAYDVVGFDPRGIGASSPVRCLSNSDMDLLFSADPTPDSPAERSTLLADVDGVTKRLRRAWRGSGDAPQHDRGRARHGRHAGAPRRPQAQLLRRLLRHVPRRHLRRHLPEEGRPDGARLCHVAEPDRRSRR